VAELQPSSSEPTPQPSLEEARFEARVLRAFVRDGRLTSIPAQDRKRRVILGWLMARCFGEDRDYEEKEVNMCLALAHPDVASLRRYLVDARFMTRRSSRYRRAPAEPSDAKAAS
jgi:hypothetical protein